MYLSDIECLPSLCKTLGSIPTTAKKKKKQIVIQEL